MQDFDASSSAPSPASARPAELDLAWHRNNDNPALTALVTAVMGAAGR